MRNNYLAARAGIVFGSNVIRTVHHTVVPPKHIFIYINIYAKIKGACTSSWLKKKATKKKRERERKKKEEIGKKKIRMAVGNLDDDGWG